MRTNSAIKENNKIRVLVICPAIDAGGIERVVFNYTTNMSDTFAFDFVVSTETRGLLEKQLLAMGYKVFHVSQILKHPIRRDEELKRILLSGNYDVVHDHTGYKGYFALKAAKAKGVPIRIAHSHTCQDNENIIQRLTRRIFSMATKHVATELFACGKKAAKYMWGEKALKSGEVYILKNPIYTQKFAFNEELRTKKREELNINDSFVIGYVARLVEGKNHSFLFDIIKNLQDKKMNVKLVLVGNGELESFYKEKTEQMGIANKVLFLGAREDVNEILNAFDLFVTPSLYEGFPVSLIEAQYNSLEILASDTIPDDVVVSDLVTFLPLSKGPKYWSNIIENLSIERSALDICNAEYDVKVCVEEYASVLLRLKGNAI